jgi:hypothetical protein
MNSIRPFETHEVPMHAESMSLKDSAIASQIIYCHRVASDAPFLAPSPSSSAIVIASASAPDAPFGFILAVALSQFNPGIGDKGKTVCALIIRLIGGNAYGDSEDVIIAIHMLPEHNPRRPGVFPRSIRLYFAGSEER